MSLNKKIISLIKRKKMKLAIAESCTGGMLSSAITSVSGSSKVFAMGLVTYSNQAKTSILKVPQKIIKKYGAVSQETAKYMVKGLSKEKNIIFSFAVTGIAGPSGGTKEKPIGLVYFSFLHLFTLPISE